MPWLSVVHRTRERRERRLCVIAAQRLRLNRLDPTKQYYVHCTNEDPDNNVVSQMISEPLFALFSRKINIGGPQRIEHKLRMVDCYA